MNATDYTEIAPTVTNRFEVVATGETGTVYPLGAYPTARAATRALAARVRDAGGRSTTDHEGRVTVTAPDGGRTVFTIRFAGR